MRPRSGPGSAAHRVPECLVLSAHAALPTEPAPLLRALKSGSHSVQGSVGPGEHGTDPGLVPGLLPGPLGSHLGTKGAGFEVPLWSCWSVWLPGHRAAASKWSQETAAGPSEPFATNDLHRPTVLQKHGHYNIKNHLK